MRRGLEHPSSFVEREVRRCPSCSWHTWWFSAVNGRCDSTRQYNGPSTGSEHWQLPLRTAIATSNPSDPGSKNKGFLEVCWENLYGEMEGFILPGIFQESQHVPYSEPLKIHIDRFMGQFMANQASRMAGSRYYTEPLDPATWLGVMFILNFVLSMTLKKLAKKKQNVSSPSNCDSKLLLSIFTKKISKIFSYWFIYDISTKSQPSRSHENSDHLGSFGSHVSTNERFQACLDRFVLQLRSDGAVSAGRWDEAALPGDDLIFPTSHDPLPAARTITVGITVKGKTLEWPWIFYCHA